MPSVRVGSVNSIRRDSRLAAQVRSIRISGRASEVVGLEMEFVGGDRSVMSITPERPGAAGRTTP